MESTGKKKNTAKNIIFFFLMCLVGLAVSMSVKFVYQEKYAKTEDDKAKIEEYGKRISELNEEIDKLQKQYDKNSEMYLAQVTSLANADSSFYNLLTQYHSNIDEAKAFAGLTAAEGEGIAVTISDSKQSEDMYSGSLVVHDSTLMELVNDLRAAGAKAISINGERVVAKTEFVCVGPAVKVNGTRLFAPFVVKAIGNPTELTHAVKSGNVYANQAVGVSVKTEEYKKMTVEGYNKSYK